MSIRRTKGELVKQCIRPFLWRVLRFSGVGIFILTPVSFVIYMALMSLAGMTPMAAGWARAGCMLLPTFLASRYVTWRNRRHGGLGRQFGWFLLGRPVTLALHMSILWVSLQSGLASYWSYWISVSLTGVFNFFWGDKVSFGSRMEETPRRQPSPPPLYGYPGLE